VTCAKKRRDSEEEAIAAAIRCSRRGKPLRVYLCPECGGWHLTSRVTIARPMESA
jgi:uncharacterized protein YlaI